MAGPAAVFPLSPSSAAGTETAGLHTDTARVCAAGRAMTWHHHHHHAPRPYYHADAGHSLCQHPSGHGRGLRSRHHQTEQPEQATEGGLFPMSARVSHQLGRWAALWCCGVMIEAAVFWRASLAVYATRLGSRLSAMPGRPFCRAALNFTKSCQATRHWQRPTLQECLVGPPGGGRDTICNCVQGSLELLAAQ